MVYQQTDLRGWGTGTKWCGDRWRWIQMLAGAGRDENKKLSYRLETGRQQRISLELSYFLSP